MPDERVWQVLNEEIVVGRAKIVKIDGIDHVQFADEDAPIPLSDLAYSKEIGLYQKSKFPDSDVE
jgi:hypothetical protein